MGKKALVAFDTDHIKKYVFGTKPLKEIRGASSRLDSLNRVETVKIAGKMAPGATKIYANGGSALFLVDTTKAEQFGQAVQQQYRERTGGGASVTYAVQPLPDKYDTYNTQQIMEEAMPDILELYNRRVQMAGVTNVEPIALSSHPFLVPCSSCGVAYAEETRIDSDDPNYLDDPDDPDDPDNPDNHYCWACQEKRLEDRNVKKSIRERRISNETLWGRILSALNKQQYVIPARPKRPKDFDTLAELAQGKEYLGLIYADANGMGKARENIKSLQALKSFSEAVDDAVFQAAGRAIAKHLPAQGNVFPFDILLIGGDDVLIVVPAAKALQVAHTLADEFYQQTHKKYTLSVGVVLAPVKYPFRLQLELAEEVLKDAKKAGSSHQIQEEQIKSGAQKALVGEDGTADPSYINFMVVTGNTSLEYKRVYRDLHRKHLPYNNPDEFYATMRPYTLDDLGKLLKYLKAGHEKHVGRTKLHQLREAILKLNRTTTILEALAALRNWKKDEREFIEDFLNVWDEREEQQKRGETLFPWIHKVGEEKIYRTPLLDFIELYDFVAAEGGVNA